MAEMLGMKRCFYASTNLILSPPGGATAANQIQGIIFDQALLGGCAMDPDMGLTVFDFADCEFKNR
jgi:DeoR/GlpR family transcriptional regulator of sugar metabolism